MKQNQRQLPTLLFSVIIRISLALDFSFFSDFPFFFFGSPANENFAVRVDQLFLRSVAWLSFWALSKIT